jgi:hypothetical protein
MKSVCFSDTPIIHNYNEVSNVSDKSKNNIEDVKEELSDNTKQVNEKVYTKYTKFCTFGLGKCKKGFKCVYAHTVKELNPITCKWNDECLRKEKCYFKHSNETKTQYIKRTFSEEIKKHNILLYEENIKEKEEIVKEEKIEEENNFNEEEYIKAITDLRLKFYDPIMDLRCWGDIPDNEDETYPYY